MTDRLCYLLAVTAGAFACAVGAPWLFAPWWDLPVLLLRDCARVAGLVGLGWGAAAYVLGLGGRR